MRLAAGAIGMMLLLLAARPAGLPAQVATGPSSHEIALTPAEWPSAVEQIATAKATPRPAFASDGLRVAQNPSSSLPLKPRASSDRTDSDKRADGIRSIVTVGGSLAAVLGIFLLIVWALRRTSHGGLGTLPADAFEVLGRAPLAGHQQVYLLRCGVRLLLVAVAPAGGNAGTLAEITDPAEVDQLIALCRQGRGNAPAGGFRRASRQVEGGRG